MSKLDRRAFVRLSAAAAIAANSSHLFGQTASPSISNTNGLVSVRGANYRWEYSHSNDSFRLLDGTGRLIGSGKMQPAVVLAPGAHPTARRCAAGQVLAPVVESGRVTLRYTGVNGNGQLSLTWRFEESGIWTDPVIYEAAAVDDVVSLHYFASVQDGLPMPALHANYLVVPGISEGSSLSPIVRDEVHLNESVWLGRGSFTPGLNQQWGLPVHYFCGFSIDQSAGARDLFTNHRSESFVCGLADLPSGDLFLQLSQGQSSLWIDYRSDLWKHLRGPGPLTLGATLHWRVAPDYYQAIGAYYQGLLQAGIIRRHRNSARKIAVMLTPQFCTWGIQESRRKTGDRLDQAFLEEVYAELKASGMKAGLFSIDDKWEGSYGNLEHSTQRLPNFEQFLDKLRAGGFKIGLWAALMRCERPADIGLTEDQMLKQPDGKPHLVSFSGSHYYILDFTRPEVAEVLRNLARRFIRRYKPDLLKFDFGYELPAMSIAAPQDKNFTGERLMGRGLEIAITAMREENPDLVVMYSNLSPLFLDYFDLHSPDDLFMASGEYELEANRRFYFSSLLGPLGVPTYGSSGYDWASAPGIWFDSAAVGTLGSLNDFKTDEEGEGVKPEYVAKYNGLAQILRTTDAFEIVPLGAISQAPTLGAHARSWARFEGGKLVLLAYRPLVPGEENPLAALSADSRVRGAVQGAVEAHFPVVVASRTTDDLGRSERLGIVAYGVGEITIRRQIGTKAKIVRHYFGGSATQAQASVSNGWLQVTGEQKDTAGNPLEWIEIDIS